MIKKSSFRGCDSCPHAWENFHNLTKNELMLISEHRFEAQFKKGEIIFKEGSPTSNAVFLISGKVKMYLEGFDGKRIITGIGKPGRLIGGPGAYVDSKHHFSVAALTDVKACFINNEILKSLVRQNSDFAEGFLKDISVKSLETLYKMIHLLQKKMHGRLADGILVLANEVFETDEFDPLLTRQELGEMTGMAKENVVRILKEFAEDGILELNGHGLKILDRRKLEIISENG